MSRTITYRDALNEAIERNEKLVKELERLSNVVGKAGNVKQRAALPSAEGQWATAIDSVNTLVSDLVQPTTAAELGDRKATHVLATEPDAYASGNPGCLVQVTAALRRAGRPTAAFHPIELVDASIRGLAPGRLLREARR